MKKFLFALLLIPSIALGADYDGDKQSDEIVAHGGSVATTTRIFIQDPVDTDIVTYMTVQEALTAGLGTAHDTEAELTALFAARPDTTGTINADELTVWSDSDTLQALTYAELWAIAGFESAAEAVLDISDLQGYAAALDAKEDNLVNEAGLYAALSDVTQFYEPGDNIVGVEGQLIDLSAITMSATVDEGLALPTYANVAPTTEKYYIAYDPDNNRLMVREAGGWVDTSAATGASATAPYITYQADGGLDDERVLTAGTAMDITNAGTDGGALTIIFDATEVGTTTWGAGAGITWTFDASAGADPTIAFADGNITLSDLTVTNAPALPADSIDAITEIAAALKSGSDGDLITGTAGTNGNLAQWNADGDLIDASFAVSDLLSSDGLNTLTELNTQITDATIGNVAGATDVSADWEWQDGQGTVYGNDANWKVAYDETTDDALEFVTAGTAAVATTDPMFLIQVDSGAAGMTADQYVFGVYKGTTELFTIDEDGDVRYNGNMSYIGGGDQVLEMNAIAAWLPFGGTPQLAFEGSSAPYSLKFWDGSVENSIMTSGDSVTWTGTTHDFSSVTNFVLPTALADASGEISLSTGNQLAWHDGTKVVKIDTTVTTDNYVLKYDNATATFNLEADADSGGAPTWDNVANPAADQTLDHDAGEETSFTYTGNFTTGSQFLIEQLTGDPTGGVLFEVKAADSNVTVAQMGGSTNVWTLSTAGRWSNSGTADINFAAASDILIASDPIDYDDMAGLVAITSSGQDLGSTTAEFNDLFLNDGGVIQLGADQDVTLTHVADTGIQMELDDSIMFGSTAEFIESDDSGYLDLDAGTGIRFNAATTFGGAIGFNNQTVSGLNSLTGTDTSEILLFGTDSLQLYSGGAVLISPDGVESFQFAAGTNVINVTTASGVTEFDFGAMKLTSTTAPEFPQTVETTLSEPDQLQPISDAWRIAYFPAEVYPSGVTINSIHITTSATCTDVLNFEEWTQSGTTSSSTVESITLSGTFTEDDGTLADASIAADGRLMVDLPATPTDIAFMEIAITFTPN